MMSRKHYVAVAALLKEHADTILHPDQALDIAVADLRDGLADLFGDDNPNFDRGRFIAACQEA